MARQVKWFDGGRRFPGEFRMPGAAALVRVESRAELKDRCRFETRWYITSSPLSAERAALATRGHWARKSAALGARRGLPRRSIASAQRSRRDQHGHRPPLRFQPRPTCPSDAIPTLFRPHRRLLLASRCLENRASQLNSNRKKTNPQPANSGKSNICRTSATPEIRVSQDSSRTTA